MQRKPILKRSGCLAAGVNAINAYIVEGRKPEDYVDYAKKDADGIVREDLLLTMSEGLNHVTEKMEKLGLVKIIRTAGLDVIQLKQNYSFEECVDNYYECISKID